MISSGRLLKKNNLNKPVTLQKRGAKLSFAAVCVAVGFLSILHVFLISFLPLSMF